MQTVTTVCDHCGKDLSHTARAMDYRLVLACEPVRRRPGSNEPLDTTTSVIPIDRPHHFCNVDCLMRWAAEQ